MKKEDLSLIIGVYEADDNKRNNPLAVDKMAKPEDMVLHAMSIAVAREIFHFVIKSICPK